MSHSMMMILGGLILLVIMVSLQKGGRAKGALRFIPIWLAISVANMIVGVLYAGYSWNEEFTVLLMVFGIPAVVAFVVSRVVKS